MPWFKVESTDKDLIEYSSRPSMRRVKSDLGITGRRCKMESQCGHWTQYRLVGTGYSFIITECA